MAMAGSHALAELSGAVHAACGQGCREMLLAAAHRRVHVCDAGPSWHRFDAGVGPLEILERLHGHLLLGAALRLLTEAPGGCWRGMPACQRQRAEQKACHRDLRLLSVSSKHPKNKFSYTRNSK